MVRAPGYSGNPLAGALAAYRERLPVDALRWVSWPKQASKLPTVIAEDLSRELALPLGWWI